MIFLASPRRSISRFVYKHNVIFKFDFKVLRWYHSLHIQKNYNFLLIGSKRAFFKNISSSVCRVIGGTLRYIKCLRPSLYSIHVKYSSIDLPTYLCTNSGDYFTSLPYTRTVVMTIPPSQSFSGDNSPSLHYTYSDYDPPTHSTKSKVLMT